MKQSTKYWKILVNLLVAVFTIVCLCVIFPKILVFFMPFVVGWIISMIANPLVRFLERKVKIVRKHSSMMIIIGVLAAVIGLGYLAVSRLVVETGNLISSLPEIYENFQADFHCNLCIFFLVELEPENLLLPTDSLASIIKISMPCLTDSDFNK